MKYSIRLHQPWKHIEAYLCMVEWANQIGPDDIVFRTDLGISYINGVTYIHNLSFRSGEDFAVFKLKFPEISHVVD